MFTGLIEEIGEVLKVERISGGMRLGIATKINTEEIAIGDSVACDGSCLTVVEKTNQSFTVELSQETVQRTTWKDVAAGRKVNLERALKMGDRLGGHIVSGHVDGVGRLVRIVSKGAAREFRIGCPSQLLRYIVEKGSITIDGISLTVNEVSSEGFTIMLIPHTQSETTLSSKREGQEVNLECDVLGKYIEKLITKEEGAIDRAYLAKYGFLK